MRQKPNRHGRFAAAHGLARLTFTQRTFEMPLPIKTEIVSQIKSLPTGTQTLSQLLVARRQVTGLTQKQLAGKLGIPRKWLGRWERGRAIPAQAQWSRLATVLKLPGELKSASL